MDGVTAELLKDGVVVDTYTFHMGIKKTVLRHSDERADGSVGDFHFEVNGKKIFVMGMNWTPLDAYHSRDGLRLQRALETLDGLGGNMVRCWGGGVYESEGFFDFCDDHGIMVWQDFAIACIIPPNNDTFLSRLKKEAETVVQRLRNHASLTFWAGDNECDNFKKWIGSMPSWCDTTRKILATAVRDYDFKTPYLPSSPYISDKIIKKGLEQPENHLWWRTWFKEPGYKDSACRFISEIGYQGCPSPQSLAKFMRPERIMPWRNEEECRKAGEDIANDDWIAHSVAVEKGGNAPHAHLAALTEKQIKILFGTAPDNIDDFARASQITQAEAHKYWIERSRIRKGEKTGVILWNLLDGYPQITNAVVDYYFTKKLAYYYVRRSQQPLCFMFDEPESGVITLYAVSELQADTVVSYAVTDLTEDKKVAEGQLKAAADKSVPVTEVVCGDKQHFYLIEWTYGGQKCYNHHLSNMPNVDYKSYLAYIARCGFDTFEGFGGK
jgi:beta-mannosidase